MKLSETILFSLAVAFLIIGVHQTFTVGILHSYWIFMLSIALLLIFKLLRNKNVEKPATPSAKPTVTPKKQSNKPPKRSVRK